MSGLADSTRRLVSTTWRDGEGHENAVMSMGTAGEQQRGREAEGPLRDPQGRVAGHPAAASKDAIREDRITLIAAGVAFWWTCWRCSRP